MDFASQNSVDMELLETMKVNKKAAERAERLRLIRERLHKIASQRAFAAELGVSQARYNNWERGWPIPEEQVKKIRDITPGITADWVFWGDESHLDVETLRKLTAKCG